MSSSSKEALPYTVADLSEVGDFRTKVTDFDHRGARAMQQNGTRRSAERRATRRMDAQQWSVVGVVDEFGMGSNRDYAIRLRLQRKLRLGLNEKLANRATVCRDVQRGMFIASNIALRSVVMMVMATVRMNVRV
jgi:hypothetical protein